MKHLKIISIILFLFSCLLGVTAQEVSPEPIGGISAIMKNVVYPKSAMKENIQGKVVLEAVIDKNGNVAEVIVLKSVNEDIDKAAMTALKKTKFIPGTKDGEPVISKVTVPFQFKLNGKKEKRTE